MPVFKVSSLLKKYSRSGLRIPVFSQPVDNCPQCGTGNFSQHNSGACSNPACGFKMPQTLAAIEEWQKASVIQQQLKEQLKEQKAASFNSVTGAKKTKKKQLPTCIFGHELDKGSEGCGVDGCPAEAPPAEFRIPRTKFTGVDGNIESRGIIIPPTWEVFNSQTKGKRSSKQLGPSDVPPGMLLDSSFAIVNEPIVRAKDLLDTEARLKSQIRDNPDSMESDGQQDSENSEELQ